MFERASEFTAFSPFGRPMYTKCKSWLIPLDMSLSLLEKR